LAAGRPLLVVQGERDAFGTPQEVQAVLPDGGRLVAVPGGHALDTSAATRSAAHAVTDFLQGVVAAAE
jgi:predicted alpha/beta-hydrolase family hydrolase